VVTFDIKENKKVYIKEISFVGNKNLSARKLRGSDADEEKSILSLVTERGILQKDILETDIDRVTAFYHDEGYMDAKVSAPEIVMKEDGFHISMSVEEGQRYKITDIKIEGDLLDKIRNQDYEKTRVQAQGLLQPGKSSRMTIDLVTKAYHERGLCAR